MYGQWIKARQLNKVLASTPPGEYNPITGGVDTWRQYAVLRQQQLDDERVAHNLSRIGLKRDLPYWVMPEAFMPEPAEVRKVPDGKSMWQSFVEILGVGTVVGKQSITTNKGV